ncbi:2-deoxyglucose-6-phosphatase, partial [Klebsiella michiganensis]
MSARRQIHAAIFDMDGLLIDSEPLWDKAELEVMASLGVDISRRHEMPDILGLRIDLVVDLWFAQQPWKGPDRAEVTARIINRAIQLVEEARPLLPGAREAVAMCKAQGLKIGLASASPLRMLEKVLTMFELRDQFDALASAEGLPFSKPHPQVYLDR